MDQGVALMIPALAKAIRLLVCSWPVWSGQQSSRQWSLLSVYVYAVGIKSVPALHQTSFAAFLLNAAYRKILIPKPTLLASLVFYAAILLAEFSVCNLLKHLGVLSCCPF